MGIWMMETGQLIHLVLVCSNSVFIKPHSGVRKQVND